MSRAIVALTSLALAVSACNSCDHSATTATPDAAPMALDATRAADAGALDWPRFPLDPRAAAALVSRPTAADASTSELDGGALADSILQSLDLGNLIVGWPAIHAWLGKWQAAIHTLGSPRNGWLLVGTHHDSAAQVRAFGTLTGADATEPFGLIVLEQLHADGNWDAVPPSLQRGDTHALTIWQKTGDRAARATLRASQERDDYAAWKFDYVDDVMSLVERARATNVAVTACDMPAELRARLPHGLDETTMLRLRELHCSLAVRDSLRDAPAPHTIAMLWGDVHVLSDGFPRSIPEGDPTLVVRMLGARASATEPDATIARRIVAIDPLLLVRGSDAFLVLPEEPSSHHVDRVRAEDGAASVRTEVALTSSRPTRVRIGRENPRVNATPTRLTLGAEARYVAVEIGERMFVASLDVANGASVEVRVEERAPELRIVVHENVTDR